MHFWKMEQLKNYRFIWEFLLIWGIWMLVILTLTDMNQQLERFSVRALASFVGFFIIIFVNVKYLFPYFFLQKKRALYFLLSVLLIAATIVLLNLEIFPWSAWYKMPEMPLIEEASRENSDNIRWFREFMHLLIALLGSTVIGVTRFASKKEKETISLEKDKLETELKFLKSQVNPHFLFNALNNIYSLALVQAPQTSETVMQLSEILRYMVYDSNKTSVALNSEINYIENFVDLKLLKDSRGMNVDVNLDKSSPHLKIAPLLFIPFVENAFKHSRIESLTDGYVKVKLEIKGKDLLFSCVNNKPKEKFTKDKVGGIGLVNTKQRLALLYPDEKHNLVINDIGNKFEISLRITLS